MTVGFIVASAARIATVFERRGIYVRDRAAKAVGHRSLSWAMIWLAEGDGLFDLKGGPVCRRRICDIEVKHSSSVVGEDDESEQDAERRGRDREEVDRHEIADVIIEESAPG